jgi:hypothetical protein
MSTLCHAKWECLPAVAPEAFGAKEGQGNTTERVCGFHSSPEGFRGSLDEFFRPIHLSAFQRNGVVKSAQLRLARLSNQAPSQRVKASHSDFLDGLGRLPALAPAFGAEGGSNRCSSSSCWKTQYKCFKMNDLHNNQGLAQLACRSSAEVETFRFCRG